MDPTRFASRGQDVVIHPAARIVYPDCLRLGNSVIIDDFVLILARSSATIGDFVHIGAHSLVTGGGEFTMESFSGLSGGVRVYTGNEDYSGDSLTNPTIPARYRNVRRSHVTIRKHAIVGANSVILPGVEIGEGAVVGAQSLVKNDCLPWTVYVGSPARAIGRRPSERILELERQLVKEAYGADGRYKPKSQWAGMG